MVGGCRGWRLSPRRSRVPGERGREGPLPEQGRRCQRWVTSTCRRERCRGGLQRGCDARGGGLLRVLVRWLVLVRRWCLQERQQGLGAAAILGAMEANRWGWRGESFRWIDDVIWMRGYGGGCCGLDWCVGEGS